MSDDRDIDAVPVTTAQLARALGALEKLVVQRIDCVDELTRARALVIDERFSSVALRFSERDIRFEQAAHDSRVAVAAALEAASNAVSEQNKAITASFLKSDADTNKQIDQLGALIQSTIAGINTQIADVKDRATRIEAEARGKLSELGEHRATATSYVGIAGLVVGSLVGLGGLLVSFLDTGSKMNPVVVAAPAAAPAPPPQVVYLPAPAPPPATPTGPSK